MQAIDLSTGAALILLQRALGKHLHSNTWNSVLTANPDSDALN